MEEKQIFYVYRWIAKDLEEVFYIGKGTRNRQHQIARRNKIFKDYYYNHDCEVEIVQYFDDEDKAFQLEKSLIKYYHYIGQAKANLDDGGKGGCHFVWTEAMKQYQSKYNPMKDNKQRMRMSQNNPMKNPNVKQQVANKISRAIVIGNQEYLNAQTAAKTLGVSSTTIRTWCDNGKNSEGIVCYYKDGIKTKKHTGGHHGSKRIAVYVDNNYFPNIKTAAQAYGFNYSTFSRCLRLGNTEFQNHICKYANQQPSQENNQNISILDGSETKECE